MRDRIDFHHRYSNHCFNRFAGKCGKLQHNALALLDSRDIPFENANFDPQLGEVVNFEEMLVGGDDFSDA